MTTSGLRGTVVDASYEDTIDLEIADGVVTTWVRGAIREKVNPAVEETPAEETQDGASTDGEAAATEQPAAEKDESTNGSARS